MSKVDALIIELDKACQAENRSIDVIFENYYSVDKYGVRLKRRGWSKYLYFFFNGLFFGYPLCCIFFFIRHWIKDDLPGINTKRKLSVGFVPCNKCYKKYEKQNI